MFAKKIFSVLIFSFTFFIAVAQKTNPIILGNARFTVNTPELIRMEYAMNGVFVDEPTLFAANREARTDSFLVTQHDRTFIISTNHMKLQYVNDGLPFSQMNIKIQVVKKGKDYNWRIYSEDDQNLGGTLVTLDGLSGPVPVQDGLLSKHGWHVIDDGDKEIFKNGWIAERPIEHLRDLYFFGYGDDYRGALKSLTTISGEVPMNRKYVHGVWYCRWWNYTDDDYREIVKGYSDHGFPLDVMVMDMAWHTQKPATTGIGHAGTYGWTGYTWNRDLIKDPQKLLDDLHKDNIYVTLNDHPHDGIRHHEEQYVPFMKAMGVDTAGQKELLFDAGSKKYMENFFKYALGPNEDMGTDFWWLDWQQDYVLPHVLGYRNLKNLPWLNYLYFKHSKKGNKRGLLFSRWGGWGSQRTPIQFSGDSEATWDMLKFQVPFTATSGNAGCFFWAHDVGGFSGERDAEQYVRWSQFALTNSSLRVHSVSDEKLDRRPWLWGEQAEKALRKVYQMRSQMMPYIYSSVWQCHKESVPLVRSMYIDYGQFSKSFENPQQYMFGDLLLSAPVAQPGSGTEHIASQKVWFPPGDVWYNIFDGRKYEGSSEDSVSVDIYNMPLFLKGGYLLPMQPYKERPASAFLDTLVLRAFPGAVDKQSSYVLYEDDGLTEDYKKKMQQFTDLQYEQKAEGAILTINAATGLGYTGQAKARAYRIELGGTPIKKASANGKKLKVISQNGELNISVVEIPKTAITKKVVVEVYY